MFTPPCPVGPRENNGTEPEDRTGALCRRQIAVSRFLQETGKEKNPINPCKSCRKRRISKYHGRSPITQHPEIYPMKFTLVTVERISTGPVTKNKNSFTLYIPLRLYSDGSARPVKFAAATMKCI